MDRIFPRFAPVWFRPVWCVIKGYHRAPIYIPVNASVGFHVSCGCCGRLRVKVKDIDG